MSAVVGLWRRDGRPIRQVEIEQMMAAAPHRGPHGSSTWCDGPVALGHQRFVIDPSVDEGAVPVSAAGGRLALTFDGRLDNGGELARRLGCQVDESPAEILIRAYRMWGPDFVSHLEGDFAVVVWDGDEDRMVLGRDPLGVRDLCYHIDGHLVLVASEIRQIRAHPDCPTPKPDEIKAALYLANSWADQEHSFFDGIRFLPPGHFGVFDRAGIRFRPTWRLDLDHRITYASGGEYDEHFRDLFRRSIVRRLPRTGPIGLSLSGGPDSAAAAAEAVEVFGAERVRAYSYVFDRYSSCDERRYISEITELLGLGSTLIPGDHHGPLVLAEDRLVDPDIATRDPYVGLARSVARAAEGDGCRILVTGHYADLLFAGGDFWAGEMASSGRWLELVRTVFKHRALLGLRRPFRHNPVAQLIPPGVRRYVVRRRSATPWIANDLVRRTDLEHRRMAEAGLTDTSLHGRSRRHQHLLLAAEVQGTASVRAMANALGIEVVDPYWDPSLVEMALAFPADRLGRPQLSKWTLRRSMAGRIPDGVRLRADKTSLFELFADALAGDARLYVERLLDRPQIVERGWVDGDWLRRELATEPPWTNYGYPLWQCIGLEMWLNELWP